MKKEQLVSFQT